MNASTRDIQESLFRLARESVGKQLTGKVVKRVHLVIPGEPLTQHRPRASSFNGKASIRTDERTHANRDSVVNAWRQKVTGPWEPWEGPVVLEVLTSHRGPKGFWEGQHCSRKPDVDNTLKLIGDALNQIAWADDKCIVRMVGEKVFGCSETLVRITFLREVTKPREGWIKVDDNEWEFFVASCFASVARATKVKGGYQLEFDGEDYGVHKTLSKAAEEVLKIGVMG